MVNKIMSSNPYVEFMLNNKGDYKIWLSNGRYLDIPRDCSISFNENYLYIDCTGEIVKHIIRLDRIDCIVSKE